jgi:hypothetical protein
LKPQEKPQNGEETRERVPEDFPDELRPHAREVMRLLRNVAAAHNAKAVTALAVGTLMMAPARRHKPFVKAAYDFASWAAAPPRPIKDVVASYRTWIDRCEDLAGVERITPGPPSTTGGSSRRGRDPEREALDARRAAALRRMTGREEPNDG